MESRCWSEGDPEGIEAKQRQVGSRYFVTASNAAKIFLKEAALHFLEFSGKSNGNRLEKDVYEKLKKRRS